MADGQASSSKWSDLGVRILSAGVIVALALGALYGGPKVWSAFVLLIYVLMLRELAKLCEPYVPTPRRWVIALTPVVVAAIAMAMPQLGADPEGFEGIWTAFRVGLLGIALVAFVPIGLGVFLIGSRRTTWLAYGAMLAVAAIALTYGQILIGPEGVLTLVAIVVISDIAGYFAGRALGGPKFWPRISPKKTWSGTIAGWIGAAIFGALVGPSVFDLSWIVGALGAVVLAFAGQMGDIVESAMKRRAGVKDSSTLIPGHGGVLDRLDALVAVAALAGVAGFLMGAFA